MKRKGIDEQAHRNLWGKLCASAPTSQPNPSAGAAPLPHPTILLMADIVR